MLCCCLGYNILANTTGKNHIVLTARVVDFFAERVINVWNYCLPPSVD